MAQYPPATEEDFQKFVTAADSLEGWRVCYDGDDCKVWDQSVSFTRLI